MMPGARASSAVRAPAGMTQPVGWRSREFWTAPPKWLEQWIYESRQAHPGPDRYVPSYRGRNVAVACCLALAAGGSYALGEMTGGLLRAVAATAVFVFLSLLTLGLALGAYHHWRRSWEARELAGSHHAQMWLAAAVTGCLAVVAPVALLTT